MPQVVRHWLLLVAISGTVLLVNLGGARLWDRDEPRNAGCAAEMLLRGDWVTPVFNSELRIHKPVLLYWFMMSAYSVFGVNEFAARFWSAILGIGTVLLTYTIGRRLFNGQVGLWAGIVLSTALMFDVAGRAATPDSVFIFFTTLATAIYVWGTFRPRAGDASGSASDGVSVLAAEPQVAGQYFPARWSVAALMYGVMGIAILAKGPVGLVLPTAVIGMFLLIQRLPPAGEAATAGQRTWIGRVADCLRPFAPRHFLCTCWSMRPITAVGAALVVALPWYIWVGLRTEGDWIHGFLVEHNVGRTLRPMEGHSGPLFYYPAAIILGFFPWSVFLVPLLVETARRIGRRHAWTSGYVLAACWVGVYLGLFSIARTKLPSYITPCYPGLALLAGAFVYHWSRGELLVRKRGLYVGLALLAASGLGILIAVPLAARWYLPGERLLAAFGLIPLVGASVCLWLLARSRWQATTIGFAATALAMVTVLFGWCTARVDQHRGTERLLAAMREDPEAEIGALGCLEPSWVFYAGRSIRELRLPQSPGTSQTQAVVDSAAAGSGKVPVKRPQLDVDQYLAGGAHRYVITTDRVLQRWPKLPEGVEVVAELPYFLEQERLLVLARGETAERAARKPQPARGRAY
ncbi:MAG: glycosyltransferase family 39 protein [Pirellulaceae bacterium]|nr:glycosyltransferase family 39 protein [Pirellulaceae bacterium]